RLMAGRRSWAQVCRRTGPVVALALLAAGVFGAPSANADQPLTIEQVQAQLDGLNMAAANAVEMLNGTHQQLAAINARIATTQRELATAQTTVVRADSTVDQMARTAYTGGGISQFMEVLTSTSPQQFLDRVAAMGEASRAANGDLSLAQQARLALAQHEVELAQDKAIAADVAALAVQQQGQIATEIKAGQQLLASLQAQARAQLEALQAAQRQAEINQARIAAAGIVVPPGAPTGPVSARAMTAVAFALSQVGGIYSMNADPPKTWDCSKLTAYAWGLAGVTLTPYSYSQWSQTQRIPVTSLQPGDLLFYFGLGAHHVMMYIGGGEAVSATSPSRGVELVTDPFGGWYGPRFSGAGRVVIPA
ncbi:MAG: NlpC/P60 family protein, partial [Candidatus Nanopelagicales bacterium]